MLIKIACVICGVAADLVGVGLTQGIVWGGVASAALGWLVTGLRGARCQEAIKQNAFCPPRDCG